MTLSHGYHRIGMLLQGHFCDPGSAVPDAMHSCNWRSATSACPLMARAQLRSAVVLMPGEGKLYCVLQWYWPLMASTELLYVHLHSCQDLMSGSPGHKALVFS